MAFCYLYLLMDQSIFPAQDQTTQDGLNSVLSAFGSAIPKAQSYASYFRDHNSEAFASQLLRVYGFCTVATLLAAVGYLCVRLSLLKWAEPAAPEQITREQRAGIVRVEQVGIIAAMLVAYSDLFGWGLSSRTSYFAESINGANVLGSPVVSYPALFAILLYLFESRIYRQKARDAQVSFSAD